MIKNEQQLNNYLRASVEVVRGMGVDEAVQCEARLRQRGYSTGAHYLGHKATEHTLGRLVELELVESVRCWWDYGVLDVMRDIIGPIMFKAPEYPPVRGVTIWRLGDSGSVSSDDGVE